MLLALSFFRNQTHYYEQIKILHNINNLYVEIQNSKTINVMYKNERKKYY